MEYNTAFSDFILKNPKTPNYICQVLCIECETHTFLSLLTKRNMKMGPFMHEITEKKKETKAFLA